MKNIYLYLHSMPTYLVQHIIKKTKNQIDPSENFCLNLKEKYNQKCMISWIDDENQSVFSLIEAPSKNSITPLKEQTKGLILHGITSVNQNLIKILSNKSKEIHGRSDLITTDIKIYNDRSFLAYIVIRATNKKLLHFNIGTQKAHQLLSIYQSVIHQTIKEYDGIEIESQNTGYIAFFTTSCRAFECANSIQNSLCKTVEFINFHVGVHAGLLESKNNISQNNIIKLANYLCELGKKNQIVISSIVHQLYISNNSEIKYNNCKSVRRIFPYELKFLTALMDTMVNNYQNSKFNNINFCNDLLMSKSHLYRKCTSLTNMSLNKLFLKFRLSRSLEVLGEKNKNVSQTAFITGFNSSSYFSKCFKRNFGLSPIDFLNGSTS